MTSSLPQNAITIAADLTTALDRVIGNMPPEERTRWKGALELHGAPVLEANTLRNLVLELRKYGGAR